MNLSRFLAFVLTAIAFKPLVVAQSNIYLLEKQQEYLQTSAATPAAFSSYPYLISVQSPIGTNLVTSAGTTAIPSVGSNGSPRLVVNFPTQAALDAEFPSGAFTFSGPPSYTINLTGDLYPASLPAVVSGGTWSNGVLVLDPAVANTLQFSTFSTYATGGSFGHMEFQAQSQSTQTQSGVDVSLATQPVFGITQSSTPLTSYTFPAGSLIPGAVYQAALNFDTGAFLDTTTVPNGGGLVGIYSKVLNFYIVAKPATAATAISVSPLSDLTGTIGAAVTIPVNGTGLTGGSMTTSWYFNGSQLSLFPGGRYSIQNGAALTITGATAADAGKYYALIVSPGGLVVTNEITLTMAASTPPQITTQPASAAVIGGTVVFNVTATGGGLTYQWKLNRNNIAGATTSRLILNNVNSGAAGSYTCTISNPSGTVVSSAAVLTILNQSPNLNGRLINESVSAAVATGDTLTVGFAVGGASAPTTQTEPLLIRGIGPALAGFGITGTMPDPSIQVIPLGGATLVSNDNWGTNFAAVMAADAATYAFALTPGSLDAALTVGLAAGGYSVALTGNTTGGIALAEIYDNVPSGTYQVTAPRIVDLSALTTVTTGGTLSAGFVLGGSTERTVLIRASGPTLAASFHLGNTMTDPQLTLLKSDGTTIAGNQGWGGDPQLATIAARVGGFAFTSSGSLDSAILVTLIPGVNYTASATSASGGSGKVLIEVYEVP